MLNLLWRKMNLQISEKKELSKACEIPTLNRNRLNYAPHVVLLYHHLYSYHFCIVLPLCDFITQLSNSP